MGSRTCVAASALSKHLTCVRFRRPSSLFGHMLPCPFMSAACRLPPSPRWTSFARACVGGEWLLHALRIPCGSSCSCRHATYCMACLHAPPPSSSSLLFLLLPLDEQVLWSWEGSRRLPGSLCGGALLCRVGWLSSLRCVGVVARDSPSVRTPSCAAAVLRGFHSALLSVVPWLLPLCTALGSTRRSLRLQLRMTRWCAPRTGSRL
jgi:hypothetical protein